MFEEFISHVKLFGEYGDVKFVEFTDEIDSGFGVGFFCIVSGFMSDYGECGTVVELEVGECGADEGFEGEEGMELGDGREA